MYLIFNTEQEGWDRSEQEGIALGLAYHIVGDGSRYVTAPCLTTDNTWALSVDDYNLTEEEQAAVVESVSFPEQIQRIK